MLPDFNQEFEPGLFPAEVQKNRKAGVFAARAKNDLVSTCLCWEVATVTPIFFLF